MKTAIVVAIAMVTAAHAAASSPNGEWSGRYSNDQASGDLWVRVGNANGAWSASVKATSEYVANPQFQPASDVRVSGDTVSFTLSWGTPVRWLGVVRGDSLIGTLTADHWSGTFRAARSK